MSIMQGLNAKLSKISQSSRDWKRNPWVLGWLGLIGVVLIVNFAMIVLAFVSNPGLVVQDYYEQGRAFEQHAIERITARNSIHWNIKTELPDIVGVNKPVLYGVQIQDVHGRPLRDARVTMHAYRPSNAGADFTAALSEITPGRYRVETSFPLKGAWDLIVQVERGSDSYDLTQRIGVLEQ